MKSSIGARESIPVPLRVAHHIKRGTFDSPVRTRRLVIPNDAVRVATSLRSVTVRPAKLTIAAAHTGTVVLTFHPPRRGVYQGSLRLSTDDPTVPTITIPVRGTSA